MICNRLYFWYLYTSFSTIHRWYF